MSKKTVKSNGLVDKIDSKKKEVIEEEEENPKTISSEDLIEVESSKSNSSSVAKDSESKESSVSTDQKKPSKKKKALKSVKVAKGKKEAVKNIKGKKGKEEVPKKKRSEPKKKEENGNFGTIRVRMECVSMKTSFEMLNNISSDKCYFRFKDDGFYIAASNKPKEKQKKTDTKSHQRSEIEFYFPATSLSYYKFGLLDSYSNPIELHDTCVCTKTFHNQIKNLKKGNLVFKIDVNTTDGTDKGFYIVNGRLKNHVPSLEGKNKYPRIKKFSEYYTKATPRAKPVNSELDSKMVSAKNGMCEEIEFKHFTGSKNTSMFGYNGTSDEPVVTYNFDNKDDNSSMEGDTPDDAFIMRTIRTDGCDWIYKICKLSNGVLEVYIHNQDHAPLGFRTSVGSQGTVTITVQSI